MSFFQAMAYHWRKEYLEHVGMYNRYKETVGMLINENAQKTDRNNNEVRFCRAKIQSLEIELRKRLEELHEVRFSLGQ